MTETELNELEAWARSFPEMPQAVAVLRLLAAHRRLCDSVWPGLPQWEPTEAEPQQDFYEAVAGAMHDLAEERDKLAAFKQYVHGRLDAAGVPADPESPHRAEGCRVGGRLDVLVGERDRLRAIDMEWLAAARKAIADLFDGGWKGDQPPECDTHDLYELCRGRGWADVPEPVQKIICDARDRAQNDVRKLRAGFERIGVGTFRAGWLAEAEAIWADRPNGPAVPDPLVWVARTRELVRCMVEAHHAAGLKTQHEEDTTKPAEAEDLVRGFTEFADKLEVRDPDAA